MSLREKRAQMSALVLDWQASGMSQREYAGIHNIQHRTLGYWISKQRGREESRSSFIQIVDGVASGIHIRYPHGVEITLPGSTPVGYLRALIHL